MILLICGHARSGTTLLRHLCNSHRDMAVTNELGFLAGLGRSYPANSRALLGRVWERTSRGIRWGRGVRPGFRAARFAASYLWALRANQQGVIDTASVERAMSTIFPGARVLGDKDPRYVSSLERLVGVPGLWSLVIYRDCRDVVSSYLERVRTVWRRGVGDLTFDRPERVTARWIRSIELMERYSDQLCIVRYEDLVRQPRAELERVAAWLGVDPDGYAADRVSSVQDQSIGKYRGGLSVDELALVMDLAGPTMARLGYA